MNYHDNFLNGTDFNVLKINVVAATSIPVTSIPASLVPFSPINVNTATVTRELVFDTIRLIASDRPNLAAGPFSINKKNFNMDTINVRTYLNNTEIWSLVNHTEIAHPFHIHNVNFNIIEKSGVAVSASERGWKDVVLVMPHDSAKFVTKFTDFADNAEPYMYHCHLLHHEDDGMMGQYLVLDTTRNGIADLDGLTGFSFYPNPVSSILNIETSGFQIDVVHVYSIEGQEVLNVKKPSANNINMQNLPAGMYLVEVLTPKGAARTRIVKD
jgi:bilirubin oxidase